MHYIGADDARAQDALLCVSTHKLLSDTQRMSMMDSPDYYLKNNQEMVELFHDLPEAIQSTLDIAEQCDITIPTGQLIFPKYEIPKGVALEKYLHDQTYERAKEKFGELKPELTSASTTNWQLSMTKATLPTSWLPKILLTGQNRKISALDQVEARLRAHWYRTVLASLRSTRFCMASPSSASSTPSVQRRQILIWIFADDRRDEVIEYVAKNTALIVLPTSLPLVEWRRVSPFEILDECLAFPTKILTV